MRPAIKYGPRVDSLTIDAKDDVKIAVSSCVENCLVGDFRSENNADVVGMELLAAGKLLAQFCTVNESEVLDSWKAASDMVPLWADYDKSSDILTIGTRRAIERLFE